jgi:hypothetical protein
VVPQVQAVLVAEPLVLLPHPGLPPQEMALRTLAVVAVVPLVALLLVLGELPVMAALVS